MFPETSEHDEQAVQDLAREFMQTGATTRVALQLLFNLICSRRMGEQHRISSPSQQQTHGRTGCPGEQACNADQPRRHKPPTSPPAGAKNRRALMALRVRL